MKKYLFLCASPAGYLLHCISEFARSTQSHVRLYHLPVSSEAPFELDLAEIDIICKTEISLHKFRDDAISFAADVLFVAGWVDKDYRYLASWYKRRGRTVICGLDNPWKASLRQWAVCRLARYTTRKWFTHMWVAGRRQWLYAYNMGFPRSRIYTGIYSADTSKFIYNKELVRSKTFVCIGRLEKEKGVLDLYRVFKGMSEAERRGWNLRIVGNGSLHKQMPDTSGISVSTFVQPAELASILASAGCFVLASREEPWGVVVHESALAGLPMLLSDAINAAEQFLIPGYNGFMFKSGDMDDLKKCLVKFGGLGKSEVEQMGENSRTLSQRNSPELWVANLVAMSSGTLVPEAVN